MTQNNIPMNERERKQARTKTIIAVTVVLLMICVLWFTGWGKLAFTTLFPQPTIEIDPRAQAAESGVTAYVSFDPAVYEDWIENICSISTEMTCKGMQVIFGPQLKTEAETAETASVVSNVKAIMMVDEYESELTGHQQIWAVSYTYNNWNGTKDTYDYVMITDVDGVWKFDGFVMLPQNLLDNTYGSLLTPQAPTQQP